MNDQKTRAKVRAKLLDDLTDVCLGNQTPEWTLHVSAVALELMTHSRLVPGSYLTLVSRQKALLLLKHPFNPKHHNAWPSAIRKYLGGMGEPESRVPVDTIQTHDIAVVRWRSNHYDADAPKPRWWNKLMRQVGTDQWDPKEFK